MRLYWSAEEEEILRKLVELSTNVWQIAAVLKSRTPTSIVQKMSKMGIVFPETKPKIDFETFKSILKQGTRKVVL